MGLVAIAEFEPVVEAKYQLFEDGVRRWRDLDIAEWLGMEAPRNIRQTIKTYAAEFERHGTLHAARAKSEGGRPPKEYWLNFKQAMRLCTYSLTPRSEDVKTVMIDVFAKVVNGEISAAPRMELRALEVAADRIVAPILAEQREFHSQVIVRMDRQEARLSTVEHEVVNMRREGRAHRKDFSKKARATYIGTVEHHYNGKCPCCRAVQILDAGQLLPNAHFEHWHGASKNRIQDGWITCERCNMDLLNTEVRLQRTPAFLAFHDARKVYEGNLPFQGNLFV